MTLEKVLCIQRKTLPSSWVEKKSVQPLSLSDFIGQCTQSGYCFVNRPEAEKDPSLKQIIPYIVIQTEDLSQTVVYNRQGSEKRLHDLWSLGIGGHINPVDSVGENMDFKAVLLAGMIRELDEELIQRIDRDIPQFSGIISEDTTDVGSVHLGAVFRIRTQNPLGYVPGPELSEFQWKPTHTLADLNMELWSNLALDLLSRG